MSEENFNIESVPTVIFSMSNFDNNSQFIKSVFKPFSDKTVCIVDPNDVNLSQIFQVPLDNNSLIFNADIPLISNQTILQTTEQTAPLPPPVNPAQVYKCSKCSESFSKLSAFKKHVLTHKSLKKFKCTECPASYNVETNFKIHMAMHNNIGKPTCPICRISFQRNASLKSHLMIHQVEELYNCDECSAEFEKEEELNKHLQSHLTASPLDSTNLICSYCKVQFDDPKLYKEHISHHVKMKKMVLSGKKSRRTNGHRDYAHVCPICQKSFSKASLLERHERVHSGEKPFICEFCNKGFTQKGTLQIHLIKHKGIKPFHCTLCPAKFNQKGNLRVHVEKTHMAPQAGVNFYKCSHCSCIFRKIASLNIHVTKTHSSNEEMSKLMHQLKELDQQQSEQNLHLPSNTSYVKLAESYVDGTVRRYLVKQRKVGDVRWYICNYCPKEFKKPSDLIRHTRIHTREKPFLCKSCGARFSLKSSLFCHTKKHSCNNNFVCSICGKKFASVRLLNFHLKKHTQQYTCSLCSKVFSSLQKIKLHTKEVHNSETIELPLLSNTQSADFVCKHCKKSFNTLSQLKKHSLCHGTEKTYSCPVCNKSFKKTMVLKRHMQIHKGKEEEKVHENFSSDVLLSEKANELPNLNQEPQLFEVTSNPIQILSNGNEKEENPVQIYINCGDLQLGDNLYSQVKLPNADQMLFSTINDLQDGNVFSIDNSEISQIFNLSEKKAEGDPNLLSGNNTTGAAPASSTFYPSSDLNILFNLEPDFGSNHCELPSDNLALNELTASLPAVEPSVNESLADENVVVKLKCDQCKKSFTNKEAFDKHLSNHEKVRSSGKSHECNWCKKIFKKHSDLIRHIRTHTGEKPFECNLCVKKFSLKSTLLAHLRTHNPVSHKEFNCNVCNSFFTSKSSLKVHMNIHTGEKPHQCNYCRLKFHSAAHRKSHEANHHQSEDVSKKKQKNKVINLLESVAMDDLSQQITIENDQLISSNDLENVLVVQEQLQLPNDQLNILNDPPAQNSSETATLPMILPSNFLLADQFPILQLDDGTLVNIKASGLISDEEIKQIDLNLIEQDQLQQLTNENEVQVKEKRFECEICHKKYASKDVLRKHKKIHLRKYPCSKCDRSFDVLDELDKHERTHLGGRPYACQYCNNCFAKEQGLVTHLKRIHQISRGKRC